MCVKLPNLQPVSHLIEVEIEARHQKLCDLFLEGGIFPNFLNCFSTFAKTALGGLGWKLQSSANISALT